MKRVAFIITLLLLAVTGEFIVRGPLRAIKRLPAKNDFAEPYAASAAWVFGMDPYDSSVTSYLWKSAGADPKAGELLPIYPPTSLLVLAPFSVLPWRAAMLAWTCTTVGLFVFASVGLLQLAGFRVSDPRALAFLVLAVGLAPIQTGIANGSIAVAAVMLNILGLWAGTAGSDFGAALLLATGCSLKPQLGIWFLIHYVVRRRWAIALPALAMVGVCLLIATARLWHSWPIWMENYLSDLQRQFAIGSINDFSSQNPSWFQLLNLQGVLYVLHKSRVAANVGAALAFTIAFTLWVYSASKNRGRTSELLSISSLVVISLFPFYHRFYDAALLLLPICWSLRPVRSHLGLLRATSLLTLPFLIPGPAIAYSVARQSSLGAITETIFWKAIVLGHQAWTLLLLGCVLLYANLISLRQPMWEVLPDSRWALDRRKK
jgi:hypothetical protein